MLPQRRHPAKGVIEDDRTPTLIFLNVCTANRTPWLADQYVHERLVQIWRSAKHWEVGPYILMPDHLHLFARPGYGSATLIAGFNTGNRCSQERSAFPTCAGNLADFTTASVHGKALKKSAVI